MKYSVYNANTHSNLIVSDLTFIKSALWHKRVKRFAEILHIQYINAWTNTAAFCERNKFIPRDPVGSESTYLGNGLAPNKGQAITYTNDGGNYWCVIH